MRYIFLIILVFLTCLIFSQKYILLEKSQPTEISEDLLFLTDPDKIADNEEALLNLKNGKYQSFSDFEKSSGFNADVCWIGILVDTNFTECSDYIAEIPAVDSAFVYVFSDDSLLSESYIGKNIPTDMRQVKIAYTQFTPVKLKEGSTNFILLKINNFSSNHDIKGYKIVLTETHSFYKTKINERYFQGIFIGIIIIMILYNLFIYLSVRHKSYLYYILMLIGCGAIWINNYKLHFEYFFPDTPLSSIIETGILVSSFFGIFLLLFTQNFLMTRSRHKKWHFVFNIFIILLILQPVVNYVIPQFYLVFRMVSFTSGLIVFILIFILSIVSLIKKYRPARYFFLANLMFSTGAIIFILAALDVMPLSWIAMNSMQAGTILQVALFSFALADRINILKHENEESQLKIIKQLEENEALKDKVNRELEQKVKERTLEISQQKEEIMTQRDEIEAQRDLVINQKEHIEEIFEELTSSIRYAERIQAAVLPSSEQMAEILGEHFIFFVPKDIVSGDFFWATRIRERIIFCIADCTGHGVPGAFMSMLGITFLNEIVRREEVTNAADVLNHLRDNIVDSLKQQGRSMEQKDGMDISFCVIETDNQILQFAGANNPVYIIRDHELFELKADRMPIAIHERMSPFTLKEFKLEKGDCIYLFSDGYADQFGNSDSSSGGLKFKYKPFKNLLTENSQKPMDEQKAIIEKIFYQWKGNLKQIDDVTVAGFRY